MTLKRRHGSALISAICIFIYAFPKTGGIMLGALLRWNDGILRRSRFGHEGWTGILAQWVLGYGNIGQMAEFI
jgi:hypothetical protein